jgi:hypothetical protein
MVSVIDMPVVVYVGFIDLCFELILFEFLNVKYEIARFSQNIIVNGKMLYIVM